jgi:hypothetical protein
VPGPATGRTEVRRSRADDDPRVLLCSLIHSRGDPLRPIATYNTSP